MESAEAEVVPAEIQAHPELLKYWRNRYELFSKFDAGIQLDYESWFSVTPEKIGARIAERCQTNEILIDAFCGCGGNSIQFAKAGINVIAIDISASKIELAKSNARIYGVDDRITFVVADFMKLAPALSAEVIFLSPPWGGPAYANAEIFNIQTMIPMDGLEVFRLAQKITPNVAYYLPKNVDQSQVIHMAGENSEAVDIEPSLSTSDGTVVVLTAYFGSLSKRMTLSSSN